MPLSFPTATSVGEIYQDGIKKWIWNGGAWDRVDPEEAPTGDTAPSVAVIGNTWFNTDNGKMYYYDESEMWIQVSGTPLTADQRPDFSADGHSSTATEGMKIGGTKANGVQTKAGITKFSFTTTADQVSHGVLATGVKYHTGASYSTSAFTIAGNNGTAIVASVQKADFSTNTTSASHGSMTQVVQNPNATQDAQQFMNMGGINSGVRTDIIEKMAFAPGSSAVAHGKLIEQRSVATAGSDGYQAILVSGHQGAGFGGKTTRVERMNFGYNVESVEVGNLAEPLTNTWSASDSTILMFGGGQDNTETYRDDRQTVAFETGSISTGFSAMTVALSGRRASSDGTNAMLCGGLQTDQTTLYSDVWRYRFSDMAETASFASTAELIGHSFSSGGA